MYLLSEEQSKIIKEEKFEKLEDVLNEKDRIIEEVNNIDLKIQQSSKQEKVNDQDIIDLQSTIKKTLIEIKALDDENNKKLLEAMSGMEHGIKDIRQGMRAMQNYSNNDPYESFAALGGTLFIDQDS